MNSIHSLLTLSKDWLEQFNNQQNKIRADQRKTSMQLSRARASVKTTARSAESARHRAGTIFSRFSAKRASVGKTLQDGVDQAITYDRNVRHAMAENNKRLIQTRFEELNSEILPTYLASIYCGAYLNILV